jgi:hypothetical protein
VQATHRFGDFTDARRARLGDVFAEVLVGRVLPTARIAPRPQRQAPQHVDPPELHLVRDGRRPRLAPPGRPSSGSWHSWNLMINRRQWHSFKYTHEPSAEHLRAAATAWIADHSGWRAVNWQDRIGPDGEVEHVADVVLHTS